MFSREEKRTSVHVVGTDGEAKFWLKPTIVLAENHVLSSKDLVKIAAIIKGRKDEIESRWRKHFKS